MRFLPTFLNAAFVGEGIATSLSPDSSHCPLKIGANTVDPTILVSLGIDHPENPYPLSPDSGLNFKCAGNSYTVHNNIAGHVGNGMSVTLYAHKYAYLFAGSAVDLELVYLDNCSKAKEVIRECNSEAGCRDNTCRMNKRSHYQTAIMLSDPLLRDYVLTEKMNGGESNKYVRDAYCLTGEMPSDLWAAWDGVNLHGAATCTEGFRRGIGKAPATYPLWRIVKDLEVIVGKTPSGHRNTLTKKQSSQLISVTFKLGRRIVDLLEAVHDQGLIFGRTLTLDDFACPPGTPEKNTNDWKDAMFPCEVNEVIITGMSKAMTLQEAVWTIDISERGFFFTPFEILTPNGQDYKADYRHDLFNLVDLLNDFLSLGKHYDCASIDLHNWPKTEKEQKERKAKDRGMPFTVTDSSGSRIESARYFFEQTRQCQGTIFPHLNDDSLEKSEERAHFILPDILAPFPQGKKSADVAERKKRYREFKGNLAW